MRSTRPHSILAALLALGAQGCVAGDAQPDATIQPGWYIEHADVAAFRPCGQERAWRIANGAALRESARNFDLQPDTPVFVRLAGRYDPGSGEFRVAKIEQFGSPTPVRDCPMTGVVIETPANGQ